MPRTLAITLGALAVLDCEGENPQPIDSLVASFLSVFSADISAIKGRSTRGRMLALLHGFVIDDVTGLTVLPRCDLALR